MYYFSEKALWTFFFFVLKCPWDYTLPYNRFDEKIKNLFFENLLRIYLKKYVLIINLTKENVAIIKTLIKINTSFLTEFLYYRVLNLQDN